jgi:hypothetical protein
VAVIIMHNNLKILKRFDSGQLYRFFVDGRFYASEHGWEGYESRQPGCISGMNLAYAHMVDHFDLPNGLTLEYVCQLHDLIFRNIDKKLRRNRYPGAIREFRISFLVRPRATTLEGLRELMGDRDIHEAFKGDIDGCKTVGELYRAIQSRRNIRYIAQVGYLPPDLELASRAREPEELYLRSRAQVQKNITEKTQKEINHFNDTIHQLSQDQRLVFIVDSVKRLERLHPFVDGNTRVFITILLNHLLMLHGFKPVIFEEPSIFDAFTTEQIMEELLHGQELFELLLEDPTTRVFGHSILDETDESRGKITELMSELSGKLAML